MSVAGIPAPLVVVVMGVSGSGKSTIAAQLARAMGWAFLEGDDFHPPENVAKMHRGEPLTDADRLPWLHRLAEAVDRLRADRQGGTVSCSALHRAYRDLLIGARTGMALVYLRGDRTLLLHRMQARPTHFMPASLLDSQLATLEEPAADERPIVLPTTATPDATVRAIIEALAARQRQDADARMPAHDV